MKQTMRILGWILFSYLFLQAAGHAPTHYQTMFTFMVGILSYLAARVLIRVSPKHHWKIAILFIVVGGILRLAWAKYIPTIPFTDFKVYHERALAFSKGAIGEEVLKNFMYPFVLSLGYRIYPHPITGRFLNAIASTTTIVIIFLLGRELLGSVGGSIAAIFFAFLPNEINMVSVLGTEVMTTTTLVTTVYLFFLGIRRKQKSHFVFFAGLLYGLGFIFRTSILFYLPVFIILIFILPNIEVDKKRIVLIFLLGLVVFLGFIICCHSLLIGKFSTATISTQDSFPFLSGTSIEHSGMWNQEDANLYFSWPVSERDRLARREAFRRIREHFLSFLRILIAKVSILFRDNTYGNEWSLHYLDWERWSEYSFITENYVTKLNGALSQAFYVVIWGLSWVSFRKREIRETSILALMMVLFTLLPHTILEVQARYHHYIMPFLVLAASSGLTILGRKNLSDLF